MVYAYYSIAPTQIDRASVSRSVAGGYTQVPGYLPGRLALHRDLHGQGLGGELLTDALGTCVEAATVGGGRVIVVDPIDAAARDFYLRYDFTPTKTGTRMVIKVATARKALARRE